MKASRRAIAVVPRDAFVYLAVGGAAAAAATIGSHAWYWLLPLSLVPVVLVYWATARTQTRDEVEHRQVAHAADLQRTTIAALASAVDVQPQPGSPHRQLQCHSTRLAQALGLTEGEIQAVGVAAALHDIGRRVSTWQATDLPLPDLVSAALLSCH